MKLKKKNFDHDHYTFITTQECNKSTSDISAARLANLPSKSSIVDFDNKLNYLNKKNYFK